MNKITGKQRRQLKSLAHHLKPIVQLGKQGITDNLIDSIETALDKHELIKVKLLEFKKEKEEIRGKIVERTSASHVGTVGNIVILYRMSSIDKNRKIILDY